MGPGPVSHGAGPMGSGSVSHGPGPVGPGGVSHGSGKPVAGPAPEITIEEFRRAALRTGVITAATDHPNAERLLILTVDIGEPTPRQLVAGIRGAYQPAELVGKQVIVVANLKPASLRGVESQGMVLAASDDAAVVLLSPERPVQPGTPIR